MACMKPSESFTSTLRHMPAERLRLNSISATEIRLHHWSDHKGSVTADTTLSYE